MVDPNAGILHTGDIVILNVRKDTKEQAFLASDGIVRDELRILAVKDVNEITDMRDCLFRVVFKQNYNAAKDYARLQRSGASEEQFLPAREKLELEKEQNNSRASLRSVLTYGESVQLLHLKSHKFITVRPHVGAFFMKQCRHVEVVDGGTVHSNFRLQPFYKHKIQGEAVRFGEQLLFQAGKLGTTWFLHWCKETMPVDKHVPDNISRHEVNCSTISSQGFFIQLYARSEETLNFCSALRLYHTQTDSFVGASAGSIQANGRPKAPYLRHRDVDHYEGVDNLWSKGIWVVENSERISGGSLKWDCQVCLMHSGTGRYLAVEKDPIGAPPPPPPPTGILGMGAPIIKPIDPKAEIKEEIWEAYMKDIPDEDCLFIFEKIETVPGKEIPCAPKPKILLCNHRGTKKAWLTNGPAKVKAPGHEVDPAEAKKRPSLKLYFSSERKVRNAVQLECLDKLHQPYGDRPGPH